MNQMNIYTKSSIFWAKRWHQTSKKMTKKGEKLCDLRNFLYFYKNNQLKTLLYNEKTKNSERPFSLFEGV
jgi:hypothetical protein